jgi:sialic acid synthase SpsE
MPVEWFGDLQGVAKEAKIELFASVYHPDMVDIAEAFDNPVYKISSFEIDYYDLIEKVAATAKPIIISTGTATQAEIGKAVSLIKQYHNDITVLKCTSSYPTPVTELNLNTIVDLRKTGCKVGLSDHSEGIFAPVLATAIGVDMIEKHLTLDKKGLDSAFSLMPDDFRAMVGAVQTAQECLGKVCYDMPKMYRRSMVATQNIVPGELLIGNVAPMRTSVQGTMTGTGIARQNYRKGDLIDGT